MNTLYILFYDFARNLSFYYKLRLDQYENYTSLILLIISRPNVTIKIAQSQSQLVNLNHMINPTSYISMTLLSKMDRLYSHMYS